MSFQSELIDRLLGKGFIIKNTSNNANQYEKIAEVLEVPIGSIFEKNYSIYCKIENGSANGNNNIIASNVGQSKYELLEAQNKALIKELKSCVWKTELLEKLIKDKEEIIKMLKNIQ